MERRQLNRLALALAGLAVAFSLASMVPLDARLVGLVAVAGYVFLVASLHAVRASSWGEDEPDGQPQFAHAGGNMLGLAASFVLGVLGLLLAAALLARSGGASYLGQGPIFVAEHFTLITAPMVIVMALAPVLAAQGHLSIARAPTQTRRAVTLATHGLVALFALMATLGLGLATQPWQGPYILAIGLVIAWYDAVHLAGLPTFARVVEWLEKGETAETRLVIRTFARAGNAIAIALGLGAVALYVLGMPGVAVGVELLAIMLLLAGSQAASALRKAAPLELEEDIGSAQHEMQVLRFLGIVPLVATVLTGGLVMMGLFAVMSHNVGLASAVEIVRPGSGLILAILAGINLFRARLRSFETYGTVRRTVVPIAVSVLAGSAFFSSLVTAGIVSGPITESGIVVVFDMAMIMAAAVFMHARGLYPVPGLDMDRDKVPKAADDHRDYKESVERSLLIVYVASGGFLLLAIGGLSAIMFGGVSVPLPSSAAGRNASFLGLVAIGITLMLGLLVVFAQSRKLSTPAEEEKVVFKRKQTREEVVRLVVLSISITVAVVMAFLGVLVMTGQLATLGALELEAKHSTDFFVFAILLGMGPAGFLYNKERKRVSAVDHRLPEFLRDLAESQRTGMTLTQAVITASKTNYGALTPEIKKMAAQIEWGVPFDDALLGFAKRVDTAMVNRTVTLVIEASNSGGNVVDVLTAASEDAREIQMIQAERKGGMSIYVMIIYIAFFVFMGVIAILNAKFMPEVAKAVSGADGVTVGSITFQAFDLQAFRTLFFHAAVIQGLGGGFVAGSMEEGKPIAGLKHAFVMVIIAYVLFRFVLGG